MSSLLNQMGAGGIQFKVMPNLWLIEFASAEIEELFAEWSSSLFHSRHQLWSIWLHTCTDTQFFRTTHWNTTKRGAPHRINHSSHAMFDCGKRMSSHLRKMVTGVVQLKVALNSWWFELTSVEAVVLFTHHTRRSLLHLHRSISSLWH